MGLFKKKSCISLDFWNFFEKMSCRDEVSDDKYYNTIGIFLKRRLCQVVGLKKIQVYQNKNIFDGHRKLESQTRVDSYCLRFTLFSISILTGYCCPIQAADKTHCGVTQGFLFLWQLKSLFLPNFLSCFLVFLLVSGDARKQFN